ARSVQRNLSPGAHVFLVMTHVLWSRRGLGFLMLGAALFACISLIGATHAQVPVQSPGSSSSLIGPSWRVVQYNDGSGNLHSVLAGTQVTATFGVDGNIS